MHVTIHQVRISFINSLVMILVLINLCVKPLLKVTLMSFIKMLFVVSIITCFEVVIDEEDLSKDEVEAIQDDGKYLSKVFNNNEDDAP